MGGKTRSFRVLIMEEDSQVREVAEMMLIKLGYETALSGCGEEAIEKYAAAAIKAEKPFDLVILDLTVNSGMGGEETLKKLLEIDPKVIAIISSGYSDTVPEKGWAGFLPKPYGVEDLKVCLEKALGLAY